MKREKPTVRLAVLVSPPDKEFDGTDIQTYKLGFCTIDASGKISFPSDYGDHAEFYDLKFRAQGSVRKVEEHLTYAWELAYFGVHSVDSQNIERMYKMLKRITKARATFAVEPTTFGQYIALMCSALGINDAVQVRGTRNWIANHEYATWQGKDIQYTVDMMVANFLEPYRKAEAA